MGNLPLKGITICFTGKLSSGTRSKMQEHAKMLGAEISSSVTKRTNILVQGSIENSRKIRKAEERGIKMLSEDEYLQLVN